jgi:hypothetical protein
MIISEFLKDGTNKKCRPRIFQIICDKCKNEYKIDYTNHKKGITKYGADFCQSCKQKEQYRTGERSKSQCFNGGIASKKLMGNKKIEEIYDDIEKINRIKKECSLPGNKNPMYGKKYQTIGLKKFTESITGKKLIDIYGAEKAKKMRLKMSMPGELNPMYGKPSPHGSGNGWSGWYNGWFFRSLHELSYMINVIERFNLSWKNAEASDLKIEYLDWENKKRTYVADFLIENKYLIEVKPKKLHKSKLVILKKEAAIKFCSDKKLTYKLTYPSKLLSHIELKLLIDNGKIELLDRYKEKYKQLKMNII